MPLSVLIPIPSLLTDEAGLSKRSPNEKLSGGNHSVARAAESGSCEKWSENFNSVMSISVLEMADGRDRAGFSVVVQSHCWDAILVRMLWKWGG